MGWSGSSRRQPCSWSQSSRRDWFSTGSPGRCPAVPRWPATPPKKFSHRTNCRKAQQSSWPGERGPGRGSPAPVAAVLLVASSTGAAQHPGRVHDDRDDDSDRQPGLHPGQPALPAGRLTGRADRRDHDDQEDEAEGIGVRAHRVRGAVLAARRRPGGPCRSRLRQVIEQPAQVPAVLAFIACATRSSNSAWLSRPSAKWAPGGRLSRCVRHLRRGCAGRCSRSGNAGQDHASGTGWTELAWSWLKRAAADLTGASRKTLRRP